MDSSKEMPGTCPEVADLAVALTHLRSSTRIDDAFTATGSSVGVAHSAVPADLTVPVKPADGFPADVEEAGGSASSRVPVGSKHTSPWRAVAVVSRKAVRNGVLDNTLLYQNILNRECRPALGSRFFDETVKYEAINYALWAAHVAHWGDYLPLFGDGSAIPRQDHTVPMAGGYSVAFPDHWYNPQLPHSSNATPPWRVVAWPVPAVYESINSELLALCEMLNMAKFIRTRSTRWGNRQKLLHLLFFSDNISAVGLALRAQGLRATNSGIVLAQPIVTRIISLMHELRSLNCAFWFPYIPGHEHPVLPHMMADTFARAAAYIGAPWSDGALNGYKPVGPELQSQVMELALRHPDFDAQGRKLSRARERLLESQAP